MRNTFEYFDNDLYIEHHGVKGQKWGVRRYQNADGSLTNAGKKRYNTDTYASTISGLNKIEKQNAKLKAKSALASGKAKAAFEKGNMKKYEKQKKIAKAASESVDAGNKLINKMLSDANKKGYTLKSINKTDYARKGSLITAAIIAGPPGALTIGALNGYRAYKYGTEAGGMVERKQYYRPLE